MIDEAKKTTEILRKRAAQNVYVNTSPGSIRRLHASSHTFMKEE